MDLIIVIIATGLYSEMLPIAPLLWGSALGLSLWYFCRRLALSVYIAIAAGLFVIGLFAAEHAERIFARQDARPIVIDEILGIFITLTPASKLRLGWLYGFLIFIILDGIKPFPASWIDTHWHGGWGIMMDDLIAGIYASIILYTVIYFVSKKNEQS
ncbi:MAG: phosphatidylglycerophosphatase A [Desulfobacterales bacterium]|nr:phosphatidylglycerophosphatase A [Desulfobacterales bacterium]